MWKTVAEGTNIWNLQSTVGELELAKGDRIKVVMDLKLPLGGMFNWAVADWLAEKFVPDGLDFVDAYGSGSQGTIEMEADPAWLLAVILFIKAHWYALMIAGIFLTVIILAIIIQIKVAAAPTIPLLWIVGGIGVAALAVILTMRKAPT